MANAAAKAALEQRLYQALKRAGDQGVPIPVLIDVLYHDRPDGGPLFARHILHLLKWKLNKKLKDERIEVVYAYDHKLYKKNGRHHYRPASKPRYRLSEKSR